MSFNSKIYTLLAISFLLLIFAFSIVFANVDNSSKVIKYIEKGQIRLNYFANKLNYDIKKNQATILQLIILHQQLSLQNESEFMKELNKGLHNLQSFKKKYPQIGDNASSSINNIIDKAAMYVETRRSLLKTLQLHNEKKTQATLMAFNTTTIEFSKAIEVLEDIANVELYTQILDLKKRNDDNATIMLFSILIFIILIFFTTYRFLVLHANVKKQLSRAEIAEEKQQKLQEQLLSYNEDLENEIAKKTKEIREKIYTSFLTGLPNRNQLLEDANTYSFSYLALLNIDKFQSFNDINGEEVGNIALKLSAEFLKTLFEDQDVFFYHVGGDEFAIASLQSTSFTRQMFINLMHETLQQYKKEIFIHEGKKFSFRMSAGIAYNGKKKMLAYADMALKDAKKRNIEFSIFEDDKGLETTHKKDIECFKKLNYALETKNIHSYFQPIYPIQDKTKAIKYESLVRLEDEEGNIIPPFNFIEVAKANRIYYKITNEVIENTLAVIRKYKIPCSLNLSLNDIDNSRTMEKFFHILSVFEYPNLLSVELLETEDFIDYKTVHDFCVKVRSYGLKVALDDFGSGYSNFSHILHLPLDYIKIDATLISNIDKDPHSKIMVETIVELAKKLKVETIAEFVSSESILEVVTELGVDYAQGFHLGKPEPIEKHLRN